MHTLLLSWGLQPGLFQHTVQGTRREVVIARPRDGHQPGFGRVFVLLMAPAGADEDPTVGGQETQELADFHICKVAPIEPVVDEKAGMAPRDITFVNFEMPVWCLTPAFCSSGS